VEGRVTDIVGAAIGAAAKSGAAEKLLTAIFHLLGYDPDSHRLITDARAHVAAKKIATRGEIEIQQYRRRWEQSMAQFPPSDRINIENVVIGSFERLEDDVDFSHVKRDKIRYLLEKARLVSDRDMQDVWSRILAEEVNDPGSFSRRTFDVVSALDRSDAEDFTKVCQFCCSEHDGRPNIYLYDITNEYLGNFSLSFDKITNLEDCGLLRPLNYDVLAEIGTMFTAPDRKFLNYFGVSIWFDSQVDAVSLDKVGLTRKANSLQE
jgi:hypothetical protein